MEFVEEPGDAVVVGRDAEPAGLVAESAGQVGLAGSGRTGDEDGLSVPDPLPRGEAQTFPSGQDLGMSTIRDIL